MKNILPLLVLINLLALPYLKAEEEPSAGRERVMKVIDEELKEIDRLMRQNKKFNPELQFRKAETVLEKGRLIRERENEDYLNIDAKYRGKTKKSQFFRQSYRYYLWSKKLATAIPKRDPNYKRTPELFYILGFYEKEFGKEALALDYFKKAEATSKPGSNFNLRCKSALAEIYYNQKNYEDAKKYFEVTLKRVDDKWWTKDAHSLAWCYQKTKNYPAAINTMKKVIDKSNGGGYVDMTFLAYKDIGLFYAESDRTDDGVKYFRSQNRDVVAELLTIAAYLRDRGNYQQTFDVYNEAIESTNDNKLKVKVYLERLMLADRYYKQNQHLQDCQKLLGLWTAGSFDADQEKAYVLQMKKQVALIQKKMDNKTYKNGEQSLKEKANMAELYFSMLSQVDSKNADEYQFYNAESQFQTKQYERAAELYKKSFDQAKEKNNLKMMKLSAEGLLAALGPENQDAKNRSDYFELAYKNYLQVDQNSTKSEDIYRRLYRLLYEQGNAEGMKSVLQSYSKNFSKNTAEQDKMVASLLSLYEKKKQNDQAAELIDEVQGGKFFVSEKLKGEVYGVKQKMQLKEVESLIASGDINKAKSGYEKIYHDPKSNKLAKANSAYNLMVLSYKNNELSSTYNWGVESLDLMGNQFVTGNLPSYVAISKYLFERMQFQASADLAHRTLAKVCNGSQNQYKKILLNNAVLSYRAADQNKKIISLIDIAEKCGLPENITQAAEIEYLDSLREKKFWVDLLNRVETTQKTGQGRIAVYELEYLLDMCLDSNNHNGKYCAKLNAAVDQVRSRGDKLVGKSLDAFAYIKAEEIWKNIIIWQKIELKFPEKVFNDLLAKKLKMLEKIVEDLLSLQKMGSRLGINQSFEMLAYTYHKMAIEVDRFVPTGVSKEYVDSFRASMKQVSSSLKLKLADYKKQSLEITSKQDSIAPFKGVYPVAVPIKDRADFQVVFGGAY